MRSFVASLTDSRVGVIRMPGPPIDINTSESDRVYK